MNNEESIKVLIAGDFYPHKVLSNKQFENDFTFFEEVKEYTAKADFSLVNFESPVVNNDLIRPIDKLGPTIKCAENAMRAVKFAGFDAVTLANNHFYDYGEDGVNDTLAACAMYGVEFVGGGKDIYEAKKPLIKRMRGKSVAFINVCENEFSIASEGKGGSAPLNPVNNHYQIKQVKQQADFVIVIVHGGTEGYQLPSPRMQDTYRFFIDSGADAVINHHQHCFSGYEVYQSKPIIYGLGNFFFPALFASPKKEWHKGYVVQLLLYDNRVDFRLVPYTQCLNDSNVSFLSNRAEFDNAIKKLNETINDRVCLEKAFNELTNRIHRDFALEPIQCRYIRSLQIRRWLPSFVSRKKLLTVFDYINCESHLDILKGNVYERINK